MVADAAARSGEPQAKNTDVQVIQAVSGSCGHPGIPIRDEVKDDGECYNMSVWISLKLIY